MTVTPLGENFNLGPGELQIGLTGTLLDVSCLVNNAVIAADKDQGDSTTKLCGTVKPGATTYTYTLSGNIDTDIAESTGFFALSQAQAGKELDFTFTPSTDAGTEAAGTCIVDPLDFGGDESGQPMTSDFEFAIVDKPAYTFGGGAAAADVGAESETVEPPTTVQQEQDQQNVGQDTYAS